jgi:hypothetical protein
MAMETNQLWLSARPDHGRHVISPNARSPGHHLRRYLIGLDTDRPFHQLLYVVSDALAQFIHLVVTQYEGCYGRWRLQTLDSFTRCPARDVTKNEFSVNSI